MFLGRWKEIVKVIEKVVSYVLFCIEKGKFELVISV